MKRQLGICGFFAVGGFSLPTMAAQPIGYLDSAGCDVVAGWSQDPDIPDAPIDVHVYFTGPAGTPGAPAIATTANVHRDDLCGAIGSCAHGYYAPSPFSLHDGAPHDVYAYGIDNANEGNPQLGNSPRTLQCTPAPQSGIRRKIEGVPPLEAWRFSTFWDVLPLPPADAEQLAEGMVFPEKPLLVQADDGTPDVYLIDHGVRRLITTNDVGAWRFDLNKAEKIPAAELQSMPLGTALRSRPILLIHGGLYVVDDPQPFVIPPETSGSSSSSTSGGFSPDDTAPAPTCSFTPGPSTSDSFYWTILSGLVLLYGKRTSRTRKS